VAVGADQLSGGAGNDSFAFNFGQANGDRVVDFSVGDHLDFTGYGEGATLTQIGVTDSYLITPGEVIHLTNVFHLNTSDYLFH
jgi:serralysin